MGEEPEAKERGVEISEGLPVLRLWEDKARSAPKVREDVERFQVQSLCLQLFPRVANNAGAPFILES